MLEPCCNLSACRPIVDINEKVNPSQNYETFQDLVNKRSCEVCKEGAEANLVLCDRCEKCFHLSCLEKIGNKAEVIHEYWFCPTCMQEIRNTDLKDRHVTELFELREYLVDNKRPAGLSEEAYTFIKNQARSYEVHGNYALYRKPSERYKWLRFVPSR